MFRTLLSPLSARFGGSTPSPSPQPSSANLLSADGHHRGFRVPGGRGEGEDSPEDFARDVLVEVMRKSVERLKLAEGLRARTEVRTPHTFTSSWDTYTDAILVLC